MKKGRKKKCPKEKARERKYKNCERILAAININSAQKKVPFPQWFNVSNWFGAADEIPKWMQIILFRRSMWLGSVHERPSLIYFHYNSFCGNIFFLVAIVPFFSTISMVYFSSYFWYGFNWRFCKHETQHIYKNNRINSCCAFMNDQCIRFLAIILHFVYEIGLQMCFGFSI